MAAYYFGKETEAMDSLAEKNQKEKVKDVQHEFDMNNVAKASIHKETYIIHLFVLFLSLIVAFVWMGLVVLQHLGKSNDDIADILCVSRGSLRSYLSRIKKCQQPQSNEIII